jgi:hypothetical protein
MTAAVDSEPAVREFPCPPDLAEELRQAVADIEAGNYLELTPEQLEELGRTGTLDVFEAWLAESDD